MRLFRGPGLVKSFGLIALGGVSMGMAVPERLAPPGHMPPNTVLLSEMMRELDAKPGFTDAVMNQIQHASKAGALLTPALVHHMREIILGKDWQKLDRFPGWTMREINPTVRVVGHEAGKDKAVTGTATAGGAPTEADAKTFLDVGDYALDKTSTAIDFRHPATGKGFDTSLYVSTLGEGVMRGDGPSPLAPEHAESQRLADVLNRLSANGLDGVPFMNAIWNDERMPSTPEELLGAILATGHTVTVTDSRYFANFGHFHYKGEDVMMPFFVNSQFVVPGTKRSLLVPVAHAEYEWHIRGPLLNADVSFYFGIDGKAEFRTMDQLDQAWVMKRDAHTYTGADAIEVTRLAGSMVRTYMRLHTAHPDIPFGGYYAFGVCQDVVAAIELKMTGKTTLFPNTADGTFFTDQRDAEINSLILRIPKDRDGHPPEPERIFGSLPTEDLAGVTIPGLGADLVAVHQAWQDGTLRRTRPRWISYALTGGGALLAFATAFALWRRRSRQ